MNKKALLTSLLALTIVCSAAAINIIQKDIPGQYAVSVSGELGLYERLGTDVFYDKPITFLDLTTTAQIVMGLRNEASGVLNVTATVDSVDIMIVLWYYDGTTWTYGEYPSEGMLMLANEVLFLSVELLPDPTTVQGTYDFLVSFVGE